MRSHLTILLFAIAAGACSQPGRAVPPSTHFAPRAPIVEQLIVRPNEQTQAALNDMSRFVRSDSVEFHRRALPMVEACRRAARLRNRPADGWPEVEELVRQLAYFSVHSPGGANDPTAVFRRFIFYTEIGDDTVVAALAPYVDSPDPVLANVVRSDVLQRGYDRKLGGLIQYGLTHPDAMSPTLVEMMYRRDPDTALGNLIPIFRADDLVIGDTTLGSVSPFTIHSVREVLFWDGHRQLKQEVLNDAADRLKTLLKCDAWWVRRYVAEVLWRYRIFRRADLAVQLKMDADPRIVAAFNREKVREEEMEDTTGR